jgi:uncharacterized protein with FMN-binding domain
MLTNIKKFALSLSVIVLFAIYSLQRQSSLSGQSSDAALLVATSQPASRSNVQATVRASVVATDSPPIQPTATGALAGSAQKGTSNFGSNSAKTPTTSSTEPAEQPTETPAGQYVDGTYVGDVTNANWGDVQAQVVIAGGAIDTVEFLQFPDHRSRSRSINSEAVPTLTQEAIQAQSEDVDTVSGATDTSDAFIESLGTALDQAAR